MPGPTPGPGRCFRHTKLDNRLAYATHPLMEEKLRPDDPRVKAEQQAVRWLLRKMHEDGHSDNFTCPDET